MTAPVSHGYPDWNRVSAQVDTTLLNPGVIPTTMSPHTYNIGFVGNYTHTGFTARITGQMHRIDFEYFEDAAFTISASAYRFILNDTTRNARRVLPVLGPYMRILVTPLVIGGTHELVVWSAPVHAIPTGTSVASSVVITTTATNVVAAATSTLNSTFAWPGEATWTVTSAATAWRATLQIQTNDGTFLTIDSMQGAANQSISHTVFLPPAPVRTNFTNNGAGAANYDTYVVGRVIEAGA